MPRIHLEVIDEEAKRAKGIRPKSSSHKMIVMNARAAAMRSESPWQNEVLHQHHAVWREKSNQVLALEEDITNRCRRKTHKKTAHSES